MTSKSQVFEMNVKFDQVRAKQQLLYVSISLSTVLACMAYTAHGHSWVKIGKLSESLIIPILLVEELLKIFLTNYFNKNDKEIVPQKQKRKSSLPSAGNVFKGIFIQSVCTMLYAFTCVILGAPVVGSYEETFVLSIVLTLLTVTPTVLLLGASGALQAVFCEKSDLLTKTEDIALDLNKHHAAGAILGAWAGSIVAPLDWDRDWQAYPIPNVMGAVFGYGMANIYMCSKVLFKTGKVFITKKRS